MVPFPVFASDPSGLMIIFIPGLVFLVVGIAAVSYALTTSIENYWLKQSLRVFSVALIITPNKVDGCGYCWPNGIAIFFDDGLNPVTALINTLLVTSIVITIWWLITMQIKRMKRINNT